MNRTEWELALKGSIMNRPEWELALNVSNKEVIYDDSLLYRVSSERLLFFLFNGQYENIHQKERIIWLYNNSDYHYGKRILEIGPNFLISTLIRSTDVIDVDINNLEVINIIRPNIRCWHSSVHNLLFKQNEFDLVVAAEVLEHIPFESVKDTLFKLIYIGNEVLITLPNFGDINVESAKRRDEFFNPTHHIWEPCKNNVLPLLETLKTNGYKVEYSLSKDDWFFLIKINK